MMRVLFFFSLTVFIAFSCAIPPFNEDVALSVKLTNQMDQMAQIGPVEELDAGLEQLPFIRFIPQKYSFDRGFLVWNMSHVDIGYVAENNRLHRYPDFTGILQYDNGNQASLNYRVGSIAQTGPYLAHLNVQPTPGIPWRLNVLWFNGASISNFVLDTDIKGDLEGELGLGVDRISASIYPDPDPAFDKIDFLARESLDPTVFHEVRYNLIKDPPGIATPDTIRFGLPVILPDAPNNFYYYYYADAGFDGTGIVSYSHNGAWKTYRWDTPNLNNPEQLDISYRVDSLLTSGHLLCRDGDTAYVYDLNGNLYADFKMGDLRFVYELWDWDRDEYKMIFVLPYMTHEGVSFRIYALSTTDLDKL
ncbi:MAG TPA: hypothetical protein VMX75_07100 [Spirochaetia bacterium]|nr:hypothetical protein [Spirochaetia bacterium]